MRIVMVLLLSALCLSGTGCVMPGAYAPLDVVEQVDVERYMGRWYEIARYPNSFQKADCVVTTAEYTLRDDGRLRVVNRCRQGALDGPEESIEGVARVVDADTNARLKVRFFWPFEGDYWIIGLDPEYEWAVVGEPRRRFLWILSRTPAMRADVYADIVMHLPEHGCDPDRLIRTLQPMV